MAVVAIVVLLGAVIAAFNLANVPPPPPPTPTLIPTLSAEDLTATSAAAATQAANQQELAVTLAAVMQVTPGSLLPGIYPTGAVTPPSDQADFVAQNAWVGLINQRWLAVYAGALRSDPQQGALLLVTVTDERVDEQRFVVALSQGALRISAENVQRLTITAPNGTNYYFDVQARRFVGSLIAYADTATPLPTYTPTLTATPTDTPVPETPTATATITPTP